MPYAIIALTALIPLNAFLPLKPLRPLLPYTLVCQLSSIVV
jgi:hypothetical protein